MVYIHIVLQICTYNAVRNHIIYTGDSHVKFFKFQYFYDVRYLDCCFKGCDTVQSPCEYKRAEAVCYLNMKVKNLGQFYTKDGSGMFIRSFGVSLRGDSLLEPAKL